MSIRNLMLKKRSCGQEKEEGVMVVKNKSDETKEESNVLENLKNNHEKHVLLILSFIVPFCTSVINAQVIQITCNDTQYYIKKGKAESIVNIQQNPDHISEIIYADCDYTLDLNKMTSTFFSRSLGNIGSTIPITKINRKGNVFEIEVLDQGRNDPTNQYTVKVVVDIENKTFTQIYYDSYTDQTFFYPTGKITMSFYENL